MNGTRGNHNGAPGSPKSFREFAQPAANFVVFAIACKIFQQEYSVAFNNCHIGKRRFGSFGVVNRRSVIAGKARGNAPGKQGNGQLRSDLQQQLFDTLFFGRLDGQNWMARIDKQQQFVALAGFLPWTRRDRACVGVSCQSQRKFACKGLFDRPASVP